MQLCFILIKIVRDLSNLCTKVVNLKLTPSHTKFNPFFLGAERRFNFDRVKEDEYSNNVCNMNSCREGSGVTELLGL